MQLWERGGSEAPRPVRSTPDEGICEGEYTSPVPGCRRGSSRLVEFDAGRASFQQFILACSIGPESKYI